TASAGTSKVRPAKPSEMKTITLPSELSEPARKSWLMAGPGWSLAQLGSEFMLTCAGCGSCPVNFTFPTTDAPELAGAGAFAAPDAPLAENAAVPPIIKIARLAIVRNCCFVFMRVNSSNGPESLAASPGLYQLLCAAARRLLGSRKIDVAIQRPFSSD